MKNKKGIQLGNAAGAVLALILVALLVIVAIFIFSNFSTITLSPGASLTKVNDSSTANVNELGSSFTFANTLISPTCAFTQCVNASDGKVIPASNWTATNCNVAYVGVNPDPYNNTLWKCSYSASCAQLSFLFNLFPQLANIQAKNATYPGTNVQQK